MAFDSTRKTRIAVTGLARSGKTAFLTSLLWQLDEYENAVFRLENNVKMTQFRGIAAKSTFPFEESRNLMAAEQSRWPRKTRDSHKYVCTFKRSARWRRWRKQQVEFLDFPGERMADAGIALHDDFAHWSDYMFAQFAGNPDHRDAVHDYEQELENIVAALTNQTWKDAEKVEPLLQQMAHSYKRLLARFALYCRALVSPSVFMLDRRGDDAKGDQPGKLAEKRLCGLDESSQFAPLPKHLAGKIPMVVRELQKRYKRYRKEVVIPVIADLSHAHSVIVLVDIPSLLLGGVDRYNDNREVVLALLEAMQGHSGIGKMLGKLWFWSPAVQRVAFVATKADMVRKSNLDQGRLKFLLRSMTRRARDLLPDADVDWFDCSSCISTTQMDDDKLRGVPLCDNPERLLMEFPVSSLPEEWPNDWDPNSYQFPNVVPRPPRNRQIPPRHRNLDAVFDFVAM